MAYKFAPSQDVHLLLAIDAEIAAQRGENIETTAHQAVTERHYHVASVDPDGSAVLELYIDNAKLSLSRNGNPPIVYDTQYNLVPPREFEHVHNSVGKRLAQMRINVRGKLLSMNDSPGGPSDDPSQTFLDVLPDKPVHVGDVWYDDVTLKLAVSKYLKEKVILRRRYTLDGVTGRVARIRLQTAELTPVEDPQLRAQLIQQAFDGTILFDMEKGLVTSRVLRCVRSEIDVIGQGSVIKATTNLKGSLR